MPARAYRDLTICRSTSQRLHGSQDPAAHDSRPSQGRSYCKQLGQAARAGRLQCLRCLCNGRFPLSTRVCGPTVRRYTQLLSAGRAAFSRAKEERRTTRSLGPRGHTEAVKPWKNEVLVMSIASAWFSGVPKVCLGVRPPVPGGRAVLCAVVNLWSSGAVLFVPLVLAANKRSGSADRPYGYRTHLLEAGKPLHAVVWSGLPFGEQYVCRLQRHTHPDISSRDGGPRGQTKKSWEFLQLAQSMHERKFP